jgi:chemotaxis protein MotB
MARRRSIPEQADNHERWMVSYADFITLLFAVFVVMYSTALSEGAKFGGAQYQSLSASILQALNLPQPAEAAQQPDITQESEAAARSAEDGIRVPLRRLEDRSASIDAIIDTLGDSLGQLAVASGLDIRRRDPFVEISIPSRMIFPAGSQVLLANALPLLRTVAAGLREMPNDVAITAHTDSLFIDDGVFPSNWELTTARAALIARVFIEEGIDPQRLSATGFAGYRPVASNDSAEGRERNRRIVLRVSAEPGPLTAAGPASVPPRAAGATRG